MRDTPAAELVRRRSARRIFVRRFRDSRNLRRVQDRSIRVLFVLIEIGHQAWISHEIRPSTQGLLNLQLPSAVLSHFFAARDGQGDGTAGGQIARR
jgi:hypothetical protein